MTSSNGSDVGAGGDVSAETSGETAPATAPRRIVVQFGTNRNRTNDTELFGNDFAHNPPGTHYVTGTIEVSVVGDTYAVDCGSLKIDPPLAAERPLAEIAAAGGDAADRFARFTADRVGTPAALSDQAAKGVFFLHGFNNSFLSAIESAARIEVGYRTGNVICFCWPSQHSLGCYLTDREICRKSGPAVARAFANFLAPLAAAAQTPPLQIIAHSMGAYALSRAIAAITPVADHLLTRQYFEHAFLMAPDVDHDALTTSELGRLPTLAGDVQVYTNKHDFLLFLRQFPNGLRGALGLWGPGDLRPLPKVIWVNASVAASKEDPTGFGHSYYNLSPMVMKDARQVLAGKRPNAIEPRVADRAAIYDERRFTIGTEADPALNTALAPGSTQRLPRDT